MQFELPGLDSLDVAGKRVLVRVDFNVPLAEGGVITDDTRLRAAVPTVKSILERGGLPILLSHLGRPKGEVREEFRLTPVTERFSELVGAPVHKLDESTGNVARAGVDLAPAGSVVLLENVRFHPGETKGDPELAAAFASLGDLFVNDAFGTSHRDHASVCGIARHLPSAAGYLLQREIDAFRRVLETPESPFVAVLGGAKVSDKLTVIEHLLERVDSIIVGGGMAYTFLAAQGLPIGKSLVQEEQIDAVRANLERAQAAGKTIHLPIDHVVASEFSADATPEVCLEIPEDKLALDIGPKTQAAYAEVVRGAKTLVWNGPMGVFEWEPFRAGTATVGQAVADCSGYTVVGGGDSVAAIELFDLGARIDHISTGGGASLELLEGRVLPGIQALLNS